MCHQKGTDSAGRTCLSPELNECPFGHLNVIPQELLNECPFGYLNVIPGEAIDYLNENIGSGIVD